MLPPHTHIVLSLAGLKICIAYTFAFSFWVPELMASHVAVFFTAALAELLKKFYTQIWCVPSL
jgi:hypothetical protein